MSSLFKAGKKLVNEIKPMLVSPDRDSQAQSQNYYGGGSGASGSVYAQQGYAPTTGLSPYFQQAHGYQAGPSSGFYAQNAQVQGSGYFNAQSPPQTQAYPQPNTQYGPAQTLQSPQHFQQTLNQQVPQVQQAQVNPYAQQYPSPQLQYGNPASTTPSPQPGGPYMQHQRDQTQYQPQGQQLNQYQQQQQQYQQQPNVSHPNQYGRTDSNASATISSPKPQEQPYIAPNISANASFPFAPASTEPQQNWSPPVEDTTRWGSPAVAATSTPPTVTEAALPAAAELPAGEPSANPENGASQSYFHAPAGQQISMSPEQSIPYPTISPPISVSPPQPPGSHNPNPYASQIPTTSYAAPMQMRATTLPTHQPPNTAQYFPPPPRTPNPAAVQTPPPIHAQPPPSPIPQQQNNAALNQQSPWQHLQQPQQIQQLQKYVPEPQQQQLLFNNNQQYQPSPSVQMQSLSPPQDNQMVSLQQGIENLSVVPALSPSFKEVSKPIPTPAPPRRAAKDGTTPSVLRVQMDRPASAARKILCLDGGGVRGLASLVMVKHLMDRLERQRGGRLEPWQEFDMIGGTSTGGLIAIMLGRMRMSVDECIENYKILSRRIFTPVHSKSNIAGRAITKLKAEGKFESEPLEQVVKEICRKKGLDESELLKESSDDAPKVFVCAAQGINSDSVVIRSYESGSGEYDDLYDICRIWEAARATSAASTFFDPIQIGYQKYVDGALRYNNPIEKADEESRELWPNQDRLIISVGTGSAPGPNVLASNIAELGKTLVKIVTDSENENTRFMRRNQEMVDNHFLFRFNVMHGLADVRLDEWDAIGDIMAHTGSYLRLPDTARNFTLCANKMKESGQRLGYIAGDELHVYQRVQEMSTVYCEFCEDCHKGIPYLQKMFLCPDCQIYICEDCHDSHEQTHHRNMISFDIVKWMEKLPGIAPSAQCRHCAKTSKARWQCQKCDMALCRNCASFHDRRIEFFTEHRKLDADGRSFVATYPPYWSTTAAWSTSDCHCLESGNIAGLHCDRCHGANRIGQRAYECRTCRADFGSSQFLCQQCFEDDEEHREKHQFGTCEMTREDSGPDTVEEARKTLWGCSQCLEKIPEGRQHVHAHLHLKLILTPFLQELFRRVAYQTCYRKKIQGMSKQYPNALPMACGLCTKKLAFDQIGSVCLMDGCSDIFCSDCTTAKRAGHRHYLYEFVIRYSVQNYTSQITCSHCTKPYLLPVAQGLFCPDCKNHFLCLDCMSGIWKGGTPKIEIGLPHIKLLKQCKVKQGWEFYLMESLKVNA